VNKGYDAVNYCHTPALFAYQKSQAQHRANVYGYTELVIYVGENGEIIDEETIKPNTELPNLVRNPWR